MRFISADVLFTGDGQVHEQGVVAVENGKIQAVLPDRSSLSEESLEIHEGALCPGFVNTHCHLELSHLKGKITQGTGLPAFLHSVTQFREEDEQVKLEAMKMADSAMWENGIDAVGDISNFSDSLSVKKESKILYHTFVEVIGLVESAAESRLEAAIKTQNEFRIAGLNASLAPHAPYSLSDKLRKLVADSKPNPSSMHNQECAAEDQFFQSGVGKLKEVISKMGLSMHSIEVTGNTSLKSVLQDFDQSGNLVLVHNSFTQKEEMQWAISNWPNIFWCSCPSANIYIELRVPKVTDWMEVGATVCLGTDSLASNDQLSMVQEMGLTQMRCPQLSTNDIVQMATLNGAKALGVDSRFGTLEKGKSPGVILLSEITSELSIITDRVEVTRLV